jgi:hypothetical protein
MENQFINHGTHGAARKKSRFVDQLEFDLRNIRQIPAIELDFETFLINRLQEPAAHLSINIENGPAYGIRFFGVE